MCGALSALPGSSTCCPHHRTQRLVYSARAGPVRSGCICSPSLNVKSPKRFFFSSLLVLLPPWWHPSSAAAPVPWRRLLAGASLSAPLAACVVASARSGAPGSALPRCCFPSSRGAQPLPWSISLPFCCFLYFFWGGGQMRANAFSMGSLFLVVRSGVG